MKIPLQPSQNKAMKRCKVCYKKADTLAIGAPRNLVFALTPASDCTTPKKYWKWQKFCVEVLNIMCNSLMHVFLVSIANFWKMPKFLPFSRFWLAPRGTWIQAGVKMQKFGFDLDVTVMHWQLWNWSFSSTVFCLLMNLVKISVVLMFYRG